LNDQLIAAVVRELAPALVGRTLGKVWLLQRAVLACDFRLRDERYLLISVEPNAPRFYLIRRAVRELERQARAPDAFVLMLRKQLGGAALRSVAKDEDDRIVRLHFSVRDLMGAERTVSLVAQLTGRTANLFLLDEAERVIASLRRAHGRGQEVGEHYQPPQTERTARAPTLPPFEQGDFPDLSAAADHYFSALESEREFAARAGALATRLRQEIARREKLRQNLERDLAAHGDADEHKRAGDLLLANIATAQRVGGRVRLTDYYAEGAPVIELEIDEHATLQEEAARRFARYTKAKRAAQEIRARLTTLLGELDKLQEQRAELELITHARDTAGLDALVAASDKRRGARGRSQQQRQGTGKAAPKVSEHAAVARRYLSSDGYEMLVGRGARQNDQLTFRLARPHDLWLHAADYPGSHVVVRNPKRIEIPHRTVVEAAQLAAQYSQAKQDAKVAVNYTQRKFVAKPKGAAPGLVRIASFRTLLVEPRESGERVS
jgi:predicted ribosome quality control (RQC) complex YloA/Tae2 family protein